MRPEKNLIVSEIKSRVDRTPYVLLTDYTGMQVPQFNELRNRLGGVNAELRVVKNTLLRRALADSNLPDLESYLHGQSAVVMGEADVSAAAKILKNFSAEFQKPKLKVGILDRAILNVDEIMALADLPSKDVLQAKLLGLLMAPASTLVRLINTPASQVAQVLKAYSEKGEPISGTKAEEAKPAESAPAAEATPGVEAAPAAEGAPAAEAAPTGEAATA
jgi:large subunit ribosomal protein L10